MKDPNNISDQIADAIADQVELAMQKWVNRRTPPGTPDDRIREITEFARANRSAFWNEVGPQVVAHYLKFFTEAAVELRELEKRMAKAFRSGSLMAFFGFAPPKLLAGSSAAPQLPAAAVPTPPTPININVELKPEIRLAAPARQTIKFDRDDAGKLTGAQVIKS